LKYSETKGNSRNCGDLIVDTIEFSKLALATTVSLGVWMEELAQDKDGSVALHFYSMS
jgi:hypothetical protein